MLPTIIDGSSLRTIQLLNDLIIIWDTLHDFVPFVQSKKRANTYRGVSILIKLQAKSFNLLKVSHLHGCFSRFMCELCNFHQITQSIKLNWDIFYRYICNFKLCSFLTYVIPLQSQKNILHHFHIHQLNLLM